MWTPQQADISIRALRFHLSQICKKLDSYQSSDLWSWPNPGHFLQHTISLSFFPSFFSVKLNIPQQQMG